MPGFRVWRYYSLGFVSLFIIGFFFIDCLARKNDNEIIKRTISTAVILCASATLFVGGIEYIYEDDTSFIESIKANSDKDVLLICSDGEYWYDHDIYECVNLMSDDSKICAINESQAEMNNVILPEKFILWRDVKSDVTSLKAKIERMGYEIVELGTSHTSKADICSLHKN